MKALSKSRLVQLLLHWRDSWRSRRVEQRVPAKEYEANLREIVRICHTRGIRVLLCATPDGMTDQAIEFRFLKDPNEVNRFQELYRLFRHNGQSPVEVWREIDQLYDGKVARVAQTDSAELVDLENELAPRRKLYVGPALWFYKDGIHFTELGLQEVARILARHVLQGNERADLERYLESSAYYRRNMEHFMTQWQFAAADFMLDHAEALNGKPFADSEKLRAQIASERGFYDTYYEGLFELSNAGDDNVAFGHLLNCLQQRPNDVDLRLNIARYALLAHAPVVTLNLLRAPGAEYTNRQNLYTAMWLIVHASRAIGYIDVARDQLKLIQKEFPEDSAANEVLAELSNR